MSLIWLWLVDGSGLRWPTALELPCAYSEWPWLCSHHANYLMDDHDSSLICQNLYSSNFSNWDHVKQRRPPPRFRALICQNIHWTKPLRGETAGRPLIAAQTAIQSLDADLSYSERSGLAGSQLNQRLTPSYFP